MTSRFECANFITEQGCFVMKEVVDMRSLDMSLAKTILDYISDYQCANGTSPTQRDVMQDLGLNSTATVSRYIKHLASEGLLDLSSDGTIITPDNLSAGNDVVTVNLLGTAACGIPITAIQNVEGTYRLPRELFGDVGFMVRARGNSMINAGIHNGDLLTVKRTASAQFNDIVVAMIDDEVTVKRFRPDPVAKLIRLHPENDEMTDIIVRGECTILGKVTGCIHCFN